MIILFILRESVHTCGSHVCRLLVFNFPFVSFSLKGALIVYFPPKQLSTFSFSRIHPLFVPHELDGKDANIRA